jgi:hypothetical protein
MVMKGWRRIGIVLSVIWFFGFGAYLINHTTELEIFNMGYDNCYAIYRHAVEHAEERGMQEKWMPDIEAQLQECTKKVTLDYERTRPSEYVTLAKIIVFNLITIALAWLVAWGCVAVGRWVYRGFTTP